jgi:hypothetical protein
MSAGVYNPVGGAQRIMPGQTIQSGGPQYSGAPVLQNPGGLAGSLGSQSTAASPTAGTQTQAQQAPAAASAATPNPLQPSYLPTPPTAQATTYQNPYDPSTATSELTSAAGVQDQQQQQALMSMLAAQGISPGSSAAQAAGQNLATNQVSALAPSLVSAQEYGAGLGEQSGLSNAGAMNAMTSQNLQDLLQSQEYNAGAYNTAGQTSAELSNNDWLAQLQAQLGLQQTGLNTSGELAGQQAGQQVPLDPSLFSQITSGIGAASSAAAPFSGGSFGGGSDASVDPYGIGTGAGVAQYNP